jgi:hypothetical protein
MAKVIAFILLCSHVTHQCDWTDVRLAFPTIGSCNYHVATMITDFVRAGEGKYIARHVCAEPIEDAPQ